LLSLFTEILGEGVTREVAEAAEKIIRETCKELHIELKNGYITRYTKFFMLTEKRRKP